MSVSHEAHWDRLGEFVTKVMKQKGVPGVAVGILHKGETATAGYGVTNVDHPLPITGETLFQIGSITKTFTGTAIMRLVEMGKLDLDATVRAYVPDFKVVDEAAASQATIRHLLTHVGGWVGDYFDDTGAGDDALAKYVANMADLEQLAPLGTVWSYNNASFSLTGHIIEVVTGQSYQAALKELVLEPLGLRNVYFDPGDVMTYRFAVGHNVTEEGPEVARPWPLPRSAYPAGGITCHVQDLLRYARFHLGDGRVEDETQLLRPESITLMQSPQVTIWGEKETMGLSWFLGDVSGVRKVWHGGGTTGQVSQLLLIPERGFAIAILTNADQGGFVTREVSRWALKQFLGLEVPDPAPIESSEEELAPYVGRYRRPFADIELGILGGKLVGQMTFKGGFPTRDSPPPPPPPPMSLALCERDRLLVLDGPYKDARAEIIRKPDGSIGWLRANWRIHPREA
ncbi:MAG TPA: class A beta-lactamase-related serine hydrolase [Anaerolineae bacterium]|nr:class A beta-lactamase-related serine hydrolase [Anaerolineae bacterium]